MGITEAMIRAAQADAERLFTPDVDPIFSIFPPVVEDAKVIRWRPTEYAGMFYDQPLDADHSIVLAPTRIAEYDVIEPEFRPDPVEVDRSEQSLIARHTLAIRHRLWRVLTDGELAPGNRFRFRPYTASWTWFKPDYAMILEDIETVCRQCIDVPGVVDREHFDRDRTTSRLFLCEETLRAITLSDRVAATALRYGRDNRTLDGLNLLLQTDLKLPRLVCQDVGYLDEQGSFRRFLPAGTVAVAGPPWRGPIGSPDRGPIGALKIIRNDSGPEPNIGRQCRRVSKNGEIQVHQWITFGPALYRPNAVAVVNVGPPR